MEVNWFGSANPTEHTFHATDRFLRENGFTLFGLTARSYSRTDLPAPFEFEVYAQTRFGQPYQGDAIYARDLAAPQLAALAADSPPDKLIKLACIYELIGLPDCAMEILNRFEAAARAVRRPRAAPRCANAAVARRAADVPGIHRTVRPRTSPVPAKRSGAIDRTACACPGPRCRRSALEGACRPQGARAHQAADPSLAPGSASP